MGAEPDGDGTTRPSEELRSVTLRYLAAIDRGDVDAIVARKSRAPDSMSLPTGGPPIRGFERLRRYTEVEFEAVGRFPVPEPEIEAWVRGDVGWSLARSELDDGSSLRFSFVLQLEQDEWRIVFEHISIGLTDDSEAWVPAWSQSVSDLLDSIRDDPVDLSDATAPDGTVTLVFTDIEGSTALNGSFGDRAWLEVLRAHNDLVTSVTRERGGTVVKGIGDGFLLAFPSARTALTASGAIQAAVAETFDDPGSPIRVRIGIHTGEVTREGDDLFGHAVNYAARVASAATGGEVLISGLTHDLVVGTGEFRFDAPREADLRGIEGPQQLYPLALVNAT